MFSRAELVAEYCELIMKADKLEDTLYGDPDAIVPRSKFPMELRRKQHEAMMEYAHILGARLELLGIDVDILSRETRESVRHKDRIQQIMYGDMEQR